jgi:hypothetical protein
MESLTVGVFPARAYEFTWQASSVKETPYANVKFKVERGPCAGAIVEYKGYILDNDNGKSLARVTKALNVCGWDNDMNNLSSISRNPVDIDVREEENTYIDSEGVQHTQKRLRVAFINEPGTSVGGVPLGEAAKASLQARILASAQQRGFVQAPRPVAAPQQTLGNRPPV